MFLKSVNFFGVDPDLGATEADLYLSDIARFPIWLHKRAARCILL